MTAYLALQVKQNQPSQEQEAASNGAQQMMSHFQQANFFILDKGRQVLQLHAQDLRRDHTSEEVWLEKPQGVAYSRQQTPIHFKSLQGKILQKSHLIFLTDQVEVLDAESRLLAQKAQYNLQTEYLLAEDHVQSFHISPTSGDHININAQMMESWTEKENVHYRGLVSGSIIRKKLYEPPTFYDCDDLQYWSEKSFISLEGNVVLKRKNLVAKSKRGEIYLENYNKKLRYYSLYDDVRIEETLTISPNESVKRKAFAEKLDGFAQEGKIILSGYPKVIQGKDVIKGNLMTLLDNQEVIEVDDSNSTFIVK